MGMSRAAVESPIVRLTGMDVALGTADAILHAIVRKVETALVPTPF